MGKYRYLYYTTKRRKKSMPIENSAIDQFDPSRVRAGLMRMLSELEDESLQFVMKPIVYAYNWVDAHVMDSITEDDYNRFGLLVDMTYGPSEVVSLINKLGCVTSRAWYDKKAKS